MQSVARGKGSDAAPALREYVAPRAHRHTHHTATSLVLRTVYDPSDKQMESGTVSDVSNQRGAVPVTPKNVVNETKQARTVVRTAAVRAGRASSTSAAKLHCPAAAQIK